MAVAYRASVNWRFVKVGRVKLSVCGKETGAGEIIATSANQILPSNSRGTKCCTIFTRPFFPLWKVEGRAGSKTSMPYLKKKT